MGALADSNAYVSKEVGTFGVSRSFLFKRLGTNLGASERFLTSISLCVPSFLYIGPLYRGPIYRCLVCTGPIYL